MLTVTSFILELYQYYYIAIGWFTMYMYILIKTTGGIRQNVSTNFNATLLHVASKSCLFRYTCISFTSLLEYSN